MTIIIPRVTMGNVDAIIRKEEMVAKHTNGGSQMFFFAEEDT